MSMFNKEENTPNIKKDLTAKEQEQRDEKLEKDAKAARDKANKNPVDAHGNPMPDFKGK